MTALPDIPRLYTALAECLAVLLFTPGLVARFSRRATVAITMVWAVVLSAFLGLTGNVPGPFWIPCMVAAIGLSYLYLWGTWSITLLEAGYHCARAFIVAEFAASIEWQFHCYLWPSRSPVHPLSLVLLGVVYGVVFGVLSGLQHKLPQPTEHLQISGSAALTAVMLALTAFAVSNLGFLPGSEINMSVFSIRTLVDFSGVLVLAVQHEQLRENALHNELAAMDKVLHRQYEQYKRSKEGVKLINRRYHELKLQLAIIRQEQDQAKQNAALEAIEQNIRQYEAENKTGNPVLDTLLTAKSLYCQQHGITLTCVADGAALDFMDTMDLCSLFGNALDNAIESTDKITDPERRLIHLSVARQKGFAAIRIENCFDGELKFEKGLPVTTKKDVLYHGFGVKSIQNAAAKYGGTATITTREGWFELRVLIPLGQPQQE